MIKVLFVCLGNICRSPMAEAVFKHKVKEAGLGKRITTDSAGTGDWHEGEVPHSGTRSLLQTKGIDFAGIVARKVTEDDLLHSDYIIAMDDDNVSILKDLGAAEQTNIPKLLDYVPGHDEENVPDPYFTGNFEEVYDMVNEGCDRLLHHIREKEGL